MPKTSKKLILLMPLKRMPAQRMVNLKLRTKRKKMKRNPHVPGIVVHDLVPLLVAVGDHLVHAVDSDDCPLGAYRFGDQEVHLFRVVAA